MSIRYVCGECGLWEPFEGRCAVDGNPLDATDDPLVGTDLGSYRLVRVLGQGGMGRVYAAVNPSSGSRVAIKLIAEKYAKDKNLLDRFFAEARAVNLIKHENIVNIIDLVQTERPYIVMELITGQTLRQLASTQSPIGGIIHVMIEVLAGLAAAHAIGIVHRDLKPDNILVTASGHAKLLDFGIAKLSQPLSNVPSLRTQTGIVLGTPEYMAPEMVVGDVVDGRADLYAIGLILYELVTGRVPFKGGTDFDVMKAHVEKQPIPPRQWRPELPESLEHVIMRALSKRPQDRYENATAMQKALRRIAVELLGDAQWKPMLGDWLAPAAMTESLQAPPTAAVRRDPLRARRASQAKKKRRHWHWIVPAVAGALAFGVTAVLLVRARRPDETPRAAPPSQKLEQAIADGINAGVKAAPDAAAEAFDWRAYLPEAYELARTEGADAKLVEIMLDPVARDGTIDLAKGSGPTRFVFRSARRGAEHKGCLIRVAVTAAAAEVQVDDMSGDLDCGAPFAPDPGCSAAEVVERSGLPDGAFRLRYNRAGWRVTGAKEVDVADSCR